MNNAVISISYYFLRLKGFVRKNRNILIALISFLLLLIVLPVWHRYSENTSGQNMYRYICDVLTDYPDLHDPYVTGVCFMEVDGVKYLLIENAGECVTGIKGANGETEYFHSGTRYCVTDNGSEAAGDQTVDVRDIIRSEIAALLSDESVSYTYHKPSGRDLPLWVYPNDPAYIRVRRDTYADYMETMIYSGEADLEVRWSIARTPEQVALYLFLSDDTAVTFDRSIHGWGTVPEEVNHMLISAN